MDEKKYLRLRKKNLTVMQKLIYDRTKLTTHIRAVRREMEAWDRALIK